MLEASTRQLRGTWLGVIRSLPLDSATVAGDGHLSGMESGPSGISVSDLLKHAPEGFSRNPKNARFKRVGRHYAQDFYLERIHERQDPLKFPDSPPSLAHRAKPQMCRSRDPCFGQLALCIASSSRGGVIPEVQRM